MEEEKDGRHWVDAIIEACAGAVADNDREAVEFYEAWADEIMAVDFARGHMRA